ncbi:MAG: FAD-binding oxidoreductase [Candidatus Thermoplasmatota archaeon]|nr:FAD-binding oxidoreductase [Candidatus Thermoplasmatota archaeon]
MLEPAIHEAVRKELVAALGESKVLWMKSDLLPYTKDTYRIRFEDEYKYFPDFVVFPESTSDVQCIVRIASSKKIPLIPKGGGSNRTGMLVPVYGGIVVDTIRMNQVVAVDIANLHVTVQPGITLKELEDRLAEHKLWLTQEQGSLRVATVGGSISTSGFSRRNHKHGTIADRVMSLEAVLADGSILRTGPKVLYTSTGYRLHQLFIGSEGTLGVITEATLRVEPIPEAQEIVLAFYSDFWTVMAAAQKLMASGIGFSGAEAYEAKDMDEVGAPKGLKALLYVMLDGTRGEVEAQTDSVKKLVAGTGGVLGAHDVAMSFLTTYVEQWCGARALTGFEDVITCYVPMEHIREFYDKLWNDIGPRHGIEPLPGEKLSLDAGRYKMAGGRYWLPKGEQAWEKYQKALREIAELATRLGGSVQSCHGVGIQHRDNLDLEYSEVALETMRQIKDTFDPQNIMNPGKKLPERK